MFAAAAACLLNAAVSQAQEAFPPMEFVIPLYIAPILNNGTLGEWMLCNRGTYILFSKPALVGREREATSPAQE